MMTQVETGRAKTTSKNARSNESKAPRKDGPKGGQPGGRKNGSDADRKKGRGDTRASKNNASREVSAIRRVLHASYGQKWADVFETVKQRFPKLVSGAYADEAAALAWGLAVKTSLKNGQLRVHAGGKVTSLEDSACTSYVHPESGMLLENAFLATARRREQEREQARKAELAARMRELSPELQLHRIAGKWFAVELQAIEAGDKGSHFDVVLNRTVQASDREALHTLYGRRHVVGKRKRELQYRELREMQLTNG
jgi:hypothetical protein